MKKNLEKKKTEQKLFLNNSEQDPEKITLPSAGSNLIIITVGENTIA